MRLIDADAAVDDLGISDEDIDFKYFLERCPTVEADLVTHAKWVEGKNGYHCSKCKSEPGLHPRKRGVWLSSTCPNCAAKMDL